MKKSIVLIFFVLVAGLCKSQNAEVEFDNQTLTYYIGVFHTLPGGSSMCPSTPLTTFYHDIPDQYSYQQEIFDESGSFITNVSDARGISIQVFPGGNTYVIPFCTGGTPAQFGSTNIPEPGTISIAFTVVVWNIDTANNLIEITLL